MVKFVAVQDRGFRPGLLIEGAGGSILFPEAEHGIEAEQRDQQQSGSDAGEEQPAEGFFRGNREQDHGDRGRQQDAERAAGGDDPGGQPAGVAALAHFGDTGRADRRAGRRRGARHGREQRAGKHVGDAKPAGNPVQPGMQRRIEILAGARLADRHAFQDEQRDRQQRDRGHFLVDVLRHRIERGVRACRWP